MDTKKLRQKILDLAIMGKLVPQDPNDEPASVLLERIRAEKERLISEGKIKRPKKSKATSSESHYQNFEPPFEIPNSWEWCQVEDIFELNPKNSVSDTSLCGFIPMALVQDGFGFSHSYERRVWRDVKKGYSHFQNGDIGIAKISPCFENRKSTIFYGLPNGIGAGTSELTILRPIVVDAEFYLFLFQSIWYITEGTKDFTGVVGQQRVNKEIFTSLVIPIPPIAEQKRITTEIKRYFHFVELIEYNKETLIRNTLTTKSKILELAMQGKLVPQDPADEPATEMLKRINPNAKIITDNPHYPKLPYNWVYVALEDIVDYEQPQPYIVNDTTYSNAYATPVLTAGQSFIVGDTNEVNGIYSKLPVIIFDDFTTDSRIIDFPFKVKSSAMKILSVKEGINIQYVGTFMSITRLIGDTHKRYWISEYSKLLIPLPPIAEQTRIIEAIRIFTSNLDSIQRNLN